MTASCSAPNTASRAGAGASAASTPAASPAERSRGSSRDGRVRYLCAVRSIVRQHDGRGLHSIVAGIRHLEGGCVRVRSCIYINRRTAAAAWKRRPKRHALALQAMPHRVDRALQFFDPKAHLPLLLPQRACGAAAGAEVPALCASCLAANRHVPRGRSSRDLNGSECPKFFLQSGHANSETAGSPRALEPIGASLLRSSVWSAHELSW